MGNISPFNMVHSWSVLSHNLKANMIPSKPSYLVIHYYYMKIISLVNRGKKRYRDGTMVRALASHQYGLGSIPGLDVICGLSLLLVLVLALRVFLRVLRFFSLHKNQHFRFQFDLESEGHRFVSHQTVKCHPC